ncbi:hypothetical protein Mgra_00001809 [Meloidogyne graminicola]|uniref:Uncharacterized protein n=1 Tax=Meloidogyne graminicola TaxID=189291 RepID=A0A8S9ZYM1_9BILA|nr:hypothetical protein Mgra_00001809 [Meloidogyne graminicola]
MPQLIREENNNNNIQQQSPSIITNNNNNNTIISPPIELLVDELYKYSHPPPSYSKATNNSINNIRRIISQRELTFIAPFGGSFCRIFPSFSFLNNNNNLREETTTIQSPPPPPPPNYTELPPIYTRNLSEINRNRLQPLRYSGFQFSQLRLNRTTNNNNNNNSSTNKKRIFSGIICLIFVLITIFLFVILDRLLLD